MATSLEAQLSGMLAAHNPNPHGRILIGYSGGLDSSVLLHLLVRLREQGRETRPLLAVHVNHQLSPYALDWQRHCEEVCARANVPLRVCQAEVLPQGRGLEDEARAQRYRAFASQMAAGDTLLLAHHQEDQAETLMLRLLRGAGPKGLAAMPAARALGEGMLLRPLLEVPRQQLLGWARAEELSWIDDESNASPDFDRNYLRHKVMPLLAERWPGFAERWQQSANLCAEADQQLQQQADEDLIALGLRAEQWGWSLALAPLAQLPVFRRGNVIRRLTARHGWATPEQSHLQELERQCFPVAEGSVPCVQWGTLRLSPAGGRLYLLPLDEAPAPPPEELVWVWPEPLSWPGGGLRVRSSPTGGLVVPAGARLTVTGRRPGDRCRPAGRRHSQTLKKLLQEYGLPPWLRDRIPVLRHDNEIVAVGDLWVCAAYYRDHGEAWQLDWGRLAVPMNEVDGVPEVQKLAPGN